MQKTLLICGWKVDFVCAAAILARSVENSEVTAVSKKGLPEYLKRLAADGGGGFEKIIILGIPLGEDERKILSACRGLKKNGVDIEWLSSYPLSRAIPPELEKHLNAQRPLMEKPLCVFVAERFKISRKTPLCSLMERTAKFAETGKGDGKAKERCLLIEAAMSRFRRFRDYDDLPVVVATLARGGELDDKALKMIEEYKVYGHRELRGRGPAVNEIKRLAKIIGEDGFCATLITGETGTGKETVANLIHGHSPRSEEAFVAFNCADLSPQLIESKLFGHEKGAFTGAEKGREGAFELADGGTLFLDEIAELPMNVQAGLLRVLQENRFHRLGASSEIEVDVRIIAATNKNLFAMAAEGKFREDLLYRINVVNVHIPPLRERLDDIEDIARSHMINRKRTIPTEEQIDELKKYDWLGNVRELQNILDRSTVLKEGDFAKLLRDHKRMVDFSNDEKESDDLSECVRRKTRKVLEKHAGNKTRAAQALGITVNTLKKYLGSQ